MLSFGIAMVRPDGATPRLGLVRVLLVSVWVPVRVVTALRSTPLSAGTFAAPKVTRSFCVPENAVPFRPVPAVVLEHVAAPLLKSAQAISCDPPRATE